MIARFLALLALAQCLVPLPAVGLDPASSLAQYHRDVWEEAEGLPHYSINAIAQTRDGYLWLATYYGVVRFDGIHFQVFDKSNTPQFHSNQVFSLNADPQGNLWIGTVGGLILYSKGTFAEFGPPQGLPNASIRVLYRSKQGELWIGTTDEGLYVHRDGRFYQAGLNRQTVRSITEDRQGNLWIGTQHGLYRFREGRFQLYGVADGLPHERVICLRQDAAGVLWIGTAKGLATLKDGQIQTLSSEPFFKDQIVWTFEIDRDSNLWIGTFGGGLVRASNGRFTYPDAESGLREKAISALFEDREGSLWIGASGAGLSRLHDAPFRTLTTRHGLGGNLVQTVLAARDGSIWAGSNGGGIVRLDPNSGRTRAFTAQNGLGDAVWSFVEDHRGDVWAGSFDGAFQQFRNGSRLATYRLPGEAKNDPLLCLAEDRSGALWIGTLEHGLFRRQQGQFRSYSLQDGLPSEQIRVIREDRQGRLWIGTKKGLSILENGRFRLLTSRDGLASDFVLSIQEDSSGTIWIGTLDGGLTRYRDGKLTPIPPRAGFPCEVVFQVLEDDAGNLWISSSTGIFRVNRDELNALADGRTKHLSTVAFGIPEGLLSRECNTGRPAACKTADGRLWFATMKGLSVVDPARIPFNPLPPPVVIGGLVADGKTYAASERVVLPAGTRNLEFRYTALSLLIPARVKFRYRLLPYETNWMEGGSRREAFYTSLPPGSYRFQVTAANNDGVWNQTGTALEIELRPYFYQTAWFYGLCTLVLAAMLLSGHRLRLKRLVRQNQELEQRVEERTAKLARANQDLDVARARAEQASRARAEFLANVSHEIRTPMNAILGMTGMVLESELNPTQREHLSISKQSAEALLALLNDILDFSKIDAGHMQIRFVSFSPRECVRTVLELLQARAREKDLELNAEIDPSVPEVVVGDPGRLRQVLMNLVGNALKFTPRGRVTVAAVLESEEGGEANLRFEVADTGIGIPPEDQALIFEPFRQADSTSTRDYGGTGLGLAICARLVRAMGGSIGLESRKGRGSTFRFTVKVRLAPADQAAESRDPVPPPAAALPPLNVLLAEDNAINQRVAVHFLQKQNCRVDVAANGREAVELTAQRDYDLILMDVQMPEMDGLTATAEIRAREARTGRHIPILAMTAHAMAGDAERCLAAGMDGYVSKPVEPERLAEAIAKAIARN